MRNRYIDVKAEAAKIDHKIKEATALINSKEFIENSPPTTVKTQENDSEFKDILKPIKELCDEQEGESLSTFMTHQCMNRIHGFVFKKRPKIVLTFPGCVYRSKNTTNESRRSIPLAQRNDER